MSEINFFQESNIPNLVIFILFILPGFISLKVYTLIYPYKSESYSHYIFEIVLYSCINYVLNIWLILSYMNY
ncbi:MAG: DUF6338 family protein [Leptospirales bacterium]